MQKTVTAGMRNTTVTLDGTECAVKFSDNYRYFEVLNESGGDVTMSIYEGKNARDDGVLTVHTGTSATLAHTRTDIDTVYLNGSGAVQIAAKNSGEAVFKSSAGGGGRNIDVLLPIGRYASAQGETILDLTSSMADYTFCILCIFPSDSINYSFYAPNSSSNVNFVFSYSADFIPPNMFEKKTEIKAGNAAVYLTGEDLSPSQIKINANTQGYFYALFGVK